MAEGSETGSKSTDVGQFLQEYNLTKYKDNFVEEGVEDIRDLLEISDTELDELMRSFHMKVGERGRFRRGLKTLCKDTPEASCGVFMSDEERQAIEKLVELTSDLKQMDDRLSHEHEQYNEQKKKVLEEIRDYFQRLVAFIQLEEKNLIEVVEQLTWEDAVQQKHELATALSEAKDARKTCEEALKISAFERLSERRQTILEVTENCERFRDLLDSSTDITAPELEVERVIEILNKPPILRVVHSGLPHLNLKYETGVIEWDETLNVHGYALEFGKESEDGKEDEKEELVSSVIHLNHSAISYVPYSKDSFARGYCCFAGGYLRGETSDWIALAPEFIPVEGFEKPPHNCAVVRETVFAACRPGGQDDPTIGLRGTNPILPGCVSYWEFQVSLGNDGCTGGSLGICSEAFQTQFSNFSWTTLHTDHCWVIHVGHDRDVHHDGIQVQTEIVASFEQNDVYGMYVDLKANVMAVLQRSENGEYKTRMRVVTRDLEMGGSVYPLAIFGCNKAHVTIIPYDEVPEDVAQQLLQII